MDRTAGSGFGCGFQVFAVLNKMEEWKEHGITFFELPSYSPQLNLIETGLTHFNEKLSF